MEYQDDQWEARSLLGGSDHQYCCKQSVNRAPLMAFWSCCVVVVRFVNQFRMRKDLLLSAAPLVYQENYYLLEYARCSATQSFHPQNFTRSQRTAQHLEIRHKAPHAPRLLSQKGRTIVKKQKT